MQEGMSDYGNETQTKVKSMFDDFDDAEFVALVEDDFDYYEDEQEHLINSRYDYPND